MLTTVIKGFEVVDADGDGRGESHVAYFNNEPAAEECASQSRGYRRVKPFEKTFSICSDMADYLDMKNEQLRAKALAKLTKEEQKALGLV